MTLAVVRSRGLNGMAAPEVTVEVHLANGLPSFTLVGLPDTEVREARERVRAALQNSRFDFPTRRITVNLGPADLPEGVRALRPADRARDPRRERPVAEPLARRVRVRGRAFPVR